MIGVYESGRMLVRVIDYGVAKVLALDRQRFVQTQAGFIGTPAFASPEQFNDLGRQQIDTRSDIYSLGLVLWYLLTGRTPFTGRTIEEMRASQARPLPFDELKSAHVPSPVVALVRSMLALDPALGRRQPLNCLLPFIVVICGSSRRRVRAESVSSLDLELWPH